MKQILFRGERVDNGEIIEGNLFIPDILIKGIYICPTTNFCDFAPNYENGDDINESIKAGCALGRFIEIIPDSVQVLTDKVKWKSINDVKIN